MAPEFLSEFTSMRDDLSTLLVLSPHDILALSLRATDRATNQDDLRGAQTDLALTNAINAPGGPGAWRSSLGDGDCDLEYVARGWAYIAVSVGTPR